MPTTQTFNYTGAQQTFVVPAGVTSIVIDAYGAEGGKGGANGDAKQRSGGKGGRARGTLAVTPGETLYVNVGGAGGNVTAGWNGGGAGGNDGTAGTHNYGGGGGGASDVRRGGSALGNRRIVAAGGGGSGGYDTSRNDIAGAGGNGGGTTGSAGLHGGDGSGTNGLPGGGGTQSAGGAGGSGGGGGGDGAAGALGVGGVGGEEPVGNEGQGGGGGGGYYGGGGGEAGTSDAAGAGGGGGSSYIAGAGLTGGSTTAGQRSGNGVVTLTYDRPPTAPASITAPGSGAEVDRIATITYGAGSDPDGDAVTYDIEIQVASGGAWSRIFSGVTGTSRSYDFSGQPATTAAKLRARSVANSLTSSWTEGPTFSISHAVPGSPVTAPSPPWPGARGIDRDPVTGSLWVVWAERRTSDAGVVLRVAASHDNGRSWVVGELKAQRYVSGTLHEDVADVFTNVTAGNFSMVIDWRGCMHLTWVGTNVHGTGIHYARSQHPLPRSGGDVTFDAGYNSEAGGVTYTGTLVHADNGGMGVNLKHPDLVVSDQAYTTWTSGGTSWEVESGNTVHLVYGNGSNQKLHYRRFDVTGEDGLLTYKTPTAAGAIFLDAHTGAGATTIMRPSIAIKLQRDGKTPADKQLQIAWSHKEGTDQGIWRAVTSASAYPTTADGFTKTKLASTFWAAGDNSNRWLASLWTGTRWVIPGVGVDGSDNAYAFVWADGFGWYYTANTGTVTTPAVNANTSPNTCLSGSAGIDPDGNIWLVGRNSTAYAPSTDIDDEAADMVIVVVPKALNAQPTRYALKTPAYAPSTPFATCSRWFSRWFHAAFQQGDGDPATAEMLRHTMRPVAVLNSTEYKLKPGWD